jgi:hypothetical protein
MQLTHPYFHEGTLWGFAEKKPDEFADLCQSMDKPKLTLEELEEKWLQSKDAIIVEPELAFSEWEGSTVSGIGSAHSAPYGCEVYKDGELFGILFQVEPTNFQLTPLTPNSSRKRKTD